MLIVNDVLVSDDVVQEHFICDLDACKGACCWEGDFGAPLEKAELPILDEIYDSIKDFLTSDGRAAIEEQGKYVYFEEMGGYGTPLIDHAACAYLTYDHFGIAKCGIELAHRAGVTDFPKPISCHLYPIRVKADVPGFEALNYDKWDICSAACTLGRKEKVPVYVFLKEPLIRKYGEAFYTELCEAAKVLEE
ncbi:DUF3109 family protein [Haliscomenobacter sp.]|jgi:hypothetical protein|uniref:DUF3109 family protein n=1 Tax=Haliscomenobacter sp. TaxID=2717303 RepID=UPI003364DFEF